MILSENRCPLFRIMLQTKNAPIMRSRRFQYADITIGFWLRGLDLNQRPSGYEPDELPGCSTPRHQVRKPEPTKYSVRSNAKGRSKRPLPPKHGGRSKEKIKTCAWQTWQRPTLPRLETKYHQRWGVSRPSSEWDRVQPPRNNHQVSEEHVFREAVSANHLRAKPEPSTEGRRCCAAPAQRFAKQTRVSAKDGHWQMRMIKPIELLVPVSFMRCRTSTPGLSTWSSSTTLREYSFRGGFPA